jgi:hypothetical protein
VDDIVYYALVDRTTLKFLSVLAYFPQHTHHTPTQLCNQKYLAFSLRISKKMSLMIPVLRPTDSSMIRSSWKTVIMVAWHIWKQRSNQIFENKRRSFQALKVVFLNECRLQAYMLRDTEKIPFSGWIHYHLYSLFYTPFVLNYSSPVSSLLK